MKLAAVAVTDHDTVSGLDEAEAAGREYGVEIIRGCELGVQGQYGEIHLLGLWLPRHSAHWMPSWPACVGTGKSVI